MLVDSYTKLGVQSDANAREDDHAPLSAPNDGEDEGVGDGSVPTAHRFESLRMRSIPTPFDPNKEDKKGTKGKKGKKGGAVADAPRSPRLRGKRTDSRILSNFLANGIQTDLEAHTSSVAEGVPSPQARGRRISVAPKVSNIVEREPSSVFPETTTADADAETKAPIKVLPYSFWFWFGYFYHYFLKTKGNIATSLDAMSLSQTSPTHSKANRYARTSYLATLTS